MPKIDSTFSTKVPLVRRIGIAGVSSPSQQCRQNALRASRVETALLLEQQEKSGVTKLGPNRLAELVLSVISRALNEFSG